MQRPNFPADDMPVYEHVSKKSRRAQRIYRKVCSERRRSH